MGRCNMWESVHSLASWQVLTNQIARLPCRDRDTAVASLKSQLADAQHQISMSNRDGKVTSSVDTAGMSLQAQRQVEKLEVLNAQLEVL